MVQRSKTLPRLKLSSPAMEKVDRLGWAVGFSLKSYGVRVGIRSNDQDALSRAYDHLPQESETIAAALVDRVYSIFVRGSGTSRRFHLLYSDHQRLARTPDVDSMFDRFESDLRLFVAEHAARHVFVHAGVVGWKGKAIVIPGRSFSGKSSLVAELVRAGATYYSDEYAVFDSRGRVYPFSKPLELRNSDNYRQERYNVSHFGGESGTKPLSVGLVVMTSFKDGATWRPRKLSAGQGVLEMLNNTVSARRNPERAFATLDKVTSHANVLKGVRGEASEMARALLNRFEKSVKR